jgi:hypothetical protein
MTQLFKEYEDNLICEIGRVQKLAAQAPQRAQMMQRLEAAQAQYDAAEAAAEDFELIASLGKALQDLQGESDKIRMTQKDYLGLPDRHAALVKRIEERCKQLKKAKDFSALEALGLRLEAVKAVNLPAPQKPAARAVVPLGGLFRFGAAKAPSTLSELELEKLLSDSEEQRKACGRLIMQAGHAPQRAEMMQRLEDAQTQYDAAVSTFTDLPLIASLGAALAALQQESATLPLSEEDYLTLPARHAQLVQRVVQVCKGLAQAKQLDSLATLGGQLKLLKALELPTTPVAKGTTPQTSALLVG